jgi:hypothetical protein
VITLGAPGVSPNEFVIVTGAAGLAQLEKL